MNATTIKVEFKHAKGKILSPLEDITNALSQDLFLNALKNNIENFSQHFSIVIPKHLEKEWEQHLKTKRPTQTHKTIQAAAKLWESHTSRKNLFWHEYFWDHNDSARDLEASHTGVDPGYLADYQICKISALQMISTPQELKTILEMTLAILENHEEKNLSKKQKHVLTWVWHKMACDAYLWNDLEQYEMLCDFYQKNLNSNSQLTPHSLKSDFTYSMFLYNNTQSNSNKTVKQKNKTYLGNLVSSMVPFQQHFPDGVGNAPLEPSLVHHYSIHSPWDWAERLLVTQNTLEDKRIIHLDPQTQLEIIKTFPVFKHKPPTLSDILKGQPNKTINTHLETTALMPALAVFVDHFNNLQNTPSFETSKWLQQLIDSHLHQEKYRTEKFDPHPSEYFRRAINTVIQSSSEMLELYLQSSVQDANRVHPEYYSYDPDAYMHQAAQNITVGIMKVIIQSINRFIENHANQPEYIVPWRLSFMTLPHRFPIKPSNSNQKPDYMIAADMLSNSSEIWENYWNTKPVFWKIEMNALWTSDDFINEAKQNPEMLPRISNDSSITQIASAFSQNANLADGLHLEYFKPILNQLITSSPNAWLTPPVFRENQISKSTSQPIHYKSPLEALQENVKDPKALQALAYIVHNVLKSEKQNHPTKEPSKAASNTPTKTRI